MIKKRLELKDIKDKLDEFSPKNSYIEHLKNRLFKAKSITRDKDNLYSVSLNDAGILSWVLHIIEFSNG